MTRGMAYVAAAFLGCVQLANAQATVNVQPAHLDGPRELADQTQKAVIRDYLDAWKTMQAAFNRNQADLLSKDFIGIAKDHLSDGIHQQAAAGIHTEYRDQSHNLQIAFYSPEGLSIQITDNVEYEVQVFDKDKQISSQPVHARLIVVMTPTETRWRVRVLQQVED